MTDDDYWTTENRRAAHEAGKALVKALSRFGITLTDMRVTGDCECAGRPRIGFELGHIDLEDAQEMASKLNDAADMLGALLRN